METSVGSIGVCHGTSVLDRLIEVGEFIHGDGKQSKDSHVFIVTDTSGGLVQAVERGVSKGNLSQYPNHVEVFPCPAGVDGEKVAAFALGEVGDSYDFYELALMGVDCLLHTKFHVHTKAWICSELAAAALVAGGWVSPKIPALMMPADIGNALRGRPVKGRTK